MNKKTLTSFLFFTFIAITSNAQNNMGVATGSYSRINSMYLNPANIASSTEKITVNLIGFNVGVDNNLGTFTKISDLGQALSSKDSNSQSVFTNSGRKDFSMMVPEVNIHGPGIIFSINRKNSIAITTGIRVINQFNNFDQQLYNTVTNTNSITNTNYSYSTQKFNWTAHMWNEIGITYGGVVIDRSRSELKVGVTLRRLGGVGYLGLKGNLNVNYNAGADSFHATNSQLEFASNIVNDNQAVFNGISSSNLLSKFFGASAGSGLGGDAGIIYRYRIGKLDDDAHPTHDIVLSASVRDMGAINYNTNNSNISVGGNGYLTGKGLSNNVTNYTSFKNYMTQQGFSADTSSAATKLHMPTALILSADYRLYWRFYVNATFIDNLVNRDNFGNSYYNQFTVTPRYDSRLISIAIPITYSWLANDMKVGFGFRFSGFFIGSDDMLALFSSNQYGFDVYMGGYVPIKFKRKRRLEEHDHWERIVE